MSGQPQRAPRVGARGRTCSRRQKLVQPRRPYRFSCAKDAKLEPARMKTTGLVQVVGGQNSPPYSNGAVQEVARAIPEGSDWQPPVVAASTTRRGVLPWIGWGVSTAAIWFWCFQCAWLLTRIDTPQYDPWHILAAIVLVGALFNGAHASSRQAAYPSMALVAVSGAAWASSLVEIRLPPLSAYVVGLAGGPLVVVLQFQQCRRFRPPERSKERRRVS